MVQFLSKKSSKWVRHNHVSCFEDWEEKDQSRNELTSDKGICRTAPGTPGLLKKGNVINGK